MKLDLPTIDAVLAAIEQPMAEAMAVLKPDIEAAPDWPSTRKKMEVSGKLVAVERIIREMKENAEKESSDGS